MKRNTLIKAFFIISLLLILTSCTKQTQEIKETSNLMGTYVTITAYHEDEQVAAKAINQAFSEIIRLEKLLSDYINDSEISLLNMGQPIEHPSEDLLANLEEAKLYGDLTDGAFDITVQPILELYTKTFGEENRPPTEQEISEELKKINYRDISINGTVSISSGQKITLGGLAKGYAVDKAISILKRNGIESALVNAGGDMMAIGTKPNGEEWNIALINPRDKSDYITIIPLTNKAVVTSGDYERYFDDEKTFHHIVDPRTGHSATELISVTIIADNAFDADIISTAVFVLGEDQGIKFIENLDNVEGLIITRNKKIIRSSGFKAYEK